MSESIKTVKRVCTCENCGNEAEMVVTCTLQKADTPASGADTHQPANHDHAGTRVKGTGTCTTCGNEADVWVDL